MIGHVACEVHLVRGNDHRHAVGFELSDRVQHIADKFRIERRCHLVEQQGSWPGQDRSRYRNTLLLAPRKPVGVIASTIPESEAFEQLEPFTARSLGVCPLTPDRTERDVVQNPKVREQVESLEYEAESTTERDRVGVRDRDALPLQEDVAIVDLLEQIDTAQKRGLAPSLRLRSARRPHAH